MTTSAETISVMRRRERNSKNKWDPESDSRGEKAHQSGGQIKFTFLCFCGGPGKKRLSMKEADASVTQEISAPL